MNTIASQPAPRRDSRTLLWTALLLVGLVLFCLAFAWLDQGYYRWIAARFPNAGLSALRATLFGVVSRAHVIVILLPFVLWRPRLLGFQIGRTRQHWRVLLLLLFANCGIVAAYLWLSGGGTPYSGNVWLLTEVVTVPLVEEAMWRGLVLAILLLALRRLYTGNQATHLAVWLSGLAFGLLHAGNALAGVPAAFVAVQVLNASIWGVVYGYARARTDSIYPPILLHAAMNLVVVLA